MSPTYHLRPALPTSSSDISGIHSIQTHYILHSTKTLYYKPFTLEETAAKISHLRESNYPFIVAVADDNSPNAQNENIEREPQEEEQTDGKEVETSSYAIETESSSSPNPPCTLSSPDPPGPGPTSPSSSASPSAQLPENSDSEPSQSSSKFPKTMSIPTVLGYASLSPFRPQQGWSPTAELSLFIHPAYTRYGIGTRLLRYLLSIAGVGAVEGKKKAKSEVEGKPEEEGEVEVKGGARLEAQAQVPTPTSSLSSTPTPITTSAPPPAPPPAPSQLEPPLSLPPIRTILAIVVIDEDDLEGYYRRFGFEKVGYFKQGGEKNGKKIDVGMLGFRVD